MHRIAGDNVNPMMDTMNKIAAINITPHSKILDTCMGLGNVILNTYLHTHILLPLYHIHTYHPFVPHTYISSLCSTYIHILPWYQPM